LKELEFKRRAEEDFLARVQGDIRTEIDGIRADAADEDKELK